MWKRAEEEYMNLMEQYTAIREAMSPLRLSRSELFKLSLQKMWHDGVTVWQDWRQDLHLRTFCAIVAVSILVIALMVDKLRNRLTSLRRDDLPVFKRPKGVGRWDYEAILREGARRYPDRPYIITYSGYEYIIYPSSSFDEVKRLTSSQASALEWFKHVFFQGWRFVGSDASGLDKAVAVDLTRALPSRVHQRQIYARMGLESTFGTCPDWKTLPLFTSCLGIVATTNATGLVGPELGCDKRWVNAVQRFPIAIMLAVYACHAIPRILRPLFAWFLFAPAWSLWLYMKWLLQAVISQDMKQYAADNVGDKKRGEALLSTMPDGKFPMISWLLARYKPTEATPRQIAQDLILVSFESTPSMAGTLYFLIAELFSRPGLVQELREELSQNMVDGLLPLSHLRELEKMDSFMRESSRMNPFSYLALFRRTQKPIQLSVGPTLPAGALICVDALHIHTSEKLWVNAGTFDPMRFLKLRKEEGHENLHQFTSLGSDSPGWGDGPQACPGRSFAGHTLKIILAELLSRYEFELPPGSTKPQRRCMPNGSMAPDLGAKIMVRERRRI